MEKIIACRLCGYDTELRFELMILQKYNVGYYKCKYCLSMQTSEPYWLNEAYTDSIRALDVGGVNRVEDLRVASFIVGKAFALNEGHQNLDWGGGDGLYVRMMRDWGVDFYHYDPFAKNTYAHGFNGDPSKKYGMITAFEVWEHLPNPNDDIDQIFKMQPTVHLLTTSIFDDQDARWPYINPLTGRHVFFYSNKAMHILADKWDYKVKIINNKTILFFKKEISKYAMSFINFSLSLNSKKRYLNGIYHMKSKQSLIIQDYRLLEDKMKNQDA